MKKSRSSIRVRPGPKLGSEADNAVGMKNLQISLDNGVTWVSATNIRVIASDPDVANEVHLDITNEGVITDVICDQTVLGSEIKHYFDIIAELE
jgi:hypothetical protein